MDGTQYRMLSYRESLKNAKKPAVPVPVLDAKKFQEFQEFLAWQKAKEEEEDSESVDTSSSWIKKIEKRDVFVRKIDYSYVMGILMNIVGCRTGKNPALFWHFKRLYTENPKDFILTGELHTDDLGSNYFSFAYKRGTPGQVNFHAHGTLNCSTGKQRFLVERVDIFIDKEAYLNAANFEGEVL